MSDEQQTRFAPNDRVRVSRSFTWAREASATVSVGSGATHSPFGNYFRDVPGAHGQIRCYWLVFDVPQIDADGDGPYAAAEISEKYLEPLEGGPKPSC